jgi:hypothetical protein
MAGQIRLVMEKQKKGYYLYKEQNYKEATLFDNLESDVVALESDPLKMYVATNCVTIIEKEGQKDMVKLQALRLLLDVTKGLDTTNLNLDNTLQIEYV